MTMRVRSFESLRYVRLFAVIAAALVGVAWPSSAPSQSRSALGNAPAAILPAPPGASAQTPLQSEAVGAASALGQAFSDVAERVLPTVVSLHVEADESDESMGFPFFPFGGPGNGVVRGSGSGVIVRADGVVLTNNHVVERARRITVRLQDGRTFRGRVLGTDPSTDLALVRIDANGLRAAPLGDSDHVRVGEWVLAIGAPLGLEATVTHGVVSATGRAGIGANEIEDYLQTDASINPGNSGGPLVNLRGEVLGINTMIVGRNTGIGMAVPSRLAQSVIEQILRDGHVTRGWLGVGVQDLTPALAQGLNSPGTSGAVVNYVEPSGPAAQGGLGAGDVITAFEGQTVASAGDLIRQTARHGARERVMLTVLRDGRARTMTVTTRARPGTELRAARQRDDSAVRSARNVGLGVQFVVLAPTLAARVGVPAQTLAIADVLPAGPADEAGLRRGDLVLLAGGRPVRGPGDVLAAVRDHMLVLLVRRGQAQLFVTVRVD